MKATMHNQRGGTSRRHNDRNFDITAAEHIKPKEGLENIYWNCIDKKIYTESTKDGMMTFDEAERKFYADRYADTLEVQNQKYRKKGNYDRVRTTDDLLNSPRTCPEETILQAGSVKTGTITPEVLFDVCMDYFKKLERFDSHMHILDFAFHFDEQVPHIQYRRCWDYDTPDGLKLGQEKALEEMGFKIPFEDKKTGRFNNRKIVFDLIARDLWYETLKEHGIEIDTTVEKPSRYQMTLLELKYKMQKDEYEALKGENEALKGENEALKEENETYKKENESLKEEKEILLNDNEILLKQIAESEEQAKAAKEQKETYEKERDDAETRTAEAKEEAAAAEKEKDEHIKAINEEIEAADDRLNTIIKDRNQKYRDAIADFDNKMSDFEPVKRNAIANHVIIPVAEYETLTIAARRNKRLTEEIKEVTQKDNELTENVGKTMEYYEVYDQAMNKLKIKGKSMKSYLDDYIETGKSPFLPRVVEHIRDIVREQGLDGEER